MNLLDEHNSIRSINFKCLLTNKTYQVVGSLSTLGNLDSYRDNVSRCKDKLIREDGEIRVIDRMDLKKRFTNIEIIENENIWKGVQKRKK